MKITRLTQPQQRRLARATAGIRDAFKDTVRPDTAQERAAFTLLELIVLTFVMAALIAVLLPPLLPRRYPGQRINCINNLKQIGLAFKTWSIDNQDRLPMQVSTNEGGTRELAKGNLAYAHFQVMSNELSTPRVLFCPNDTSRHYTTKFDTNFTNLTLSYFCRPGCVRNEPLDVTQRRPMRDKRHADGARGYDPVHQPGRRVGAQDA